MGNNMGGINRRRGHALAGQKVGRGVLLGALTLIEDDQHLKAPLMGVEQRFGDRRQGKAVGVDEDAGLGSSNGVDDEIRTSSRRG